MPQQAEAAWGIIVGRKPQAETTWGIIVGNPQAAATLTELRFHSPGLRAKTATLGKHPHKNLLLCKSGQGCAPSIMD